MHLYSFMHADSEWPLAAESAAVSAFKAIKLPVKYRVRPSREHRKMNTDELWGGLHSPRHCLPLIDDAQKYN